MLVDIEGSGFLPILSDVDEGSTILHEVAVEVGGISLEGAAWQTEQLIVGTIPAGLSIGVHDVTVRLGRQTGVLVGGYVVTDGLSPPGDAPLDGITACSFGPWGAPQPIAELNTSGFEAMPRLTLDELTIFFHSTRAGGSGDRDVWTASRGSTSAAFSDPANVTQLNSGVADRDPATSGDGLIIVFTSARAGGLDLYTATRTSTAQPFSAPQLVAGVNTGSTEYFVSLSADGRALYWSSNRGGDFDIWYATRADTMSAFSAPQNLTEVESGASEFAAVPSTDGLELFLSSNASGDTDIWVSTRSAPALPFGAPVRVPELSSAGNEDLAAWLSPDGRRFYFSSGVVSTTAAIYVATRPCL